MSLINYPSYGDIVSNIESIMREIIDNKVYDDTCLSILKENKSEIQDYWIVLPHMVLSRLKDNRSGVSPEEWNSFEFILTSSLTLIFRHSNNESLRQNSIIISSRLKAWLDEKRLNLDDQGLDESILHPKELAAILDALGTLKATSPTRTRIAMALTYLTNPSFDSNLKHIQNAEVLELSNERKAELITLFSNVIKNI